MDREVVLFTKPEELVAWADTHDALLNLSVEDADILLGYMEGHDYAIGRDTDGNLYRKDISEESGETDPYSIDEIIDTVCEWNYEMILDADEERNGSEEPEDEEQQKRYQKLKADECRLDRLFDKTSYGKEIMLLADELANNIINQISLGTGVEQSVAVAMEGVRAYAADKRGR